MSSDTKGAADLSLSKARALALTSLGHFLNDGFTFFVPVVADLLVSLKGLSLLEESILLVVFYLSSTVFSIYVGRWADRAGKLGKLMAIGIACLGLGMVGFYVVAVQTSGEELFALALAFNLVMGFGSAFYHPLGASILQEAFGRRAVGKALGLNGAMGSAGRTLFPVLFSLLSVLAFNAPDSLAMLGVVGVGGAVLIWAGLSKVGTGSERKESTQVAIRSSLTKPMIALLGVTFLRSATLFGVVQYAPTFLTGQRGLGTGSVLGLSLAAFYASAILGQPFFGFLADRLDHRLVLAVSTLAAAFSIVGYVNTGGVVSVVMLSSFGFFALTGFPLLMTLAADYSARNASTLGNSLVWGLGSTGGNALGPLLIYAFALNESKLGFAFEVMAVLAAISGIAALLIPKPAVKQD